MDIVARTILSFSHKYTGMILPRLCKQSYHATIVNRAWILSKLRSYPERYKIVLPCRRHESDTSNETEGSQSVDESKKLELIQLRSILENNTFYKDTLFPKMEAIANVKSEEINELLSTDWSSKSADEHLHALKLLASSHLNSADYEPLIFDSIYQACLVKLPEFDDSQIEVLLQCLIALKSTLKSYAAIKLIKELSKNCFQQFHSKTHQQLLFTIDAFHQLCDGNYSEYMFRVIRKLCKKPHKLDERVLVQIFYYLNLHNIVRAVNMFEMGCHLEKCIENFSANEIALIARGFVLHKKPIKSSDMVSAIIKTTINSIQSMDSLFITYIMMFIRRNSKSTPPEKYRALLDTLIEELPKLSLPCLSSIIQTCSEFPIYDEALTNGILKIVMENMHLTSLRDIKQILCGICWVAPYTNYYDDICHQFLNEILSTYKTKRKNEIQKFPLSLVRIVMYLTMRNIYVPELLEFIYSQQNLYHKYYRRNDVTPELLILHCSVKIEFPQYEGPLLSPKAYDVLLTKCGSKEKIFGINRNVPIKSEIVNICMDKLGINVWTDYIVPHYRQWDIIFGMDGQNNPIDVELILSEMPQNSIKSVNSDELKAIKWHVITFTRSPLIVDHGGYVGPLHQKLRQLNILGYTPIPIYENEWVKLSEDEKEGFLRKSIYGDDLHCSEAMK